MSPSPRKSSPESLIIPTVIAAKVGDWSDSTHKVAEGDAQRVLEALVAEFGIEGTKRALVNQGFDPVSYGYLLVPLHQEALARRKRASTPS